MSRSQLSAVFQLPFYQGSGAELLDNLRQLLANQVKPAKRASKSLQLIFTPNPEQLVQAYHDPQFLSDLRQADILLPDGSFFVLANHYLHWLAKLKGRSVIPAKVQQRIHGVDVVDQLLIDAAKHNYKILIIGGRDYGQFWHKQGGAYHGETREDQGSLIELKKNLYWTEAYQDKAEPLPAEDQALSDIIDQVKPNIVFIALGAPDQERWLVKHQAQLRKQGVTLAMAVGGSFDLLFEKIKRAPRAWRRLRLEWLWRLIQQPWRWRRQLRLVEFVALAIHAGWQI